MPRRSDKSALVHALAARQAISLGAARKSVNAVLDLMADRLSKEGHLVLVGLGTFEVVDVSGGRRNPATGEPVSEVLRPRTVRFRASRLLRDQLR